MARNAHSRFIFNNYIFYESLMFISLFSTRDQRKREDDKYGQSVKYHFVFTLLFKATTLQCLIEQLKQLRITTKYCIYRWSPIHYFHPETFCSILRCVCCSSNGRGSIFPLGMLAPSARGDALMCGSYNRHSLSGLHEVCSFGIGFLISWRGVLQDHFQLRHIRTRFGIIKVVPFHFF